MKTYTFVYLLAMLISIPSWSGMMHLPTELSCTHDIPDCNLGFASEKTVNTKVRTKEVTYVKFNNHCMGKWPGESKKQKERRIKKESEAKHSKVVWGNVEHKSGNASYITEFKLRTYSDYTYRCDRFSQNKKIDDITYSSYSYDRDGDIKFFTACAEQSSSSFFGDKFLGCLSVNKSICKELSASGDLPQWANQSSCDSQLNQKEFQEAMEKLSKKTPEKLSNLYSFKEKKIKSSIPDYFEEQGFIKKLFSSSHILGKKRYYYDSKKNKDLIYYPHEWKKNNFGPQQTCRVLSQVRRVCDVLISESHQEQVQKIKGSR